MIGAAAAIGALRGLRGESLAQLLSLAATQSAGMFFQSGTDGKPPMRDWQHAMVYGLTNCCNIHHFKQVQNRLTLNGVGLKPSVILPLHQMTSLAVG